MAEKELVYKITPEYDAAAGRTAFDAFTRAAAEAHEKIARLGNVGPRPGGATGAGALGSPAALAGVQEHAKAYERLAQTHSRAHEGMLRQTQHLTHGLHQSMKGVEQLARGLTLLGVSGESDLGKLVHKLAMFEGIVASLKGVGNLAKGFRGLQEFMNTPLGGGSVGASGGGIGFGTVASGLGAANSGIGVGRYVGGFMGPGAAGAAANATGVGAMGFPLSMGGAPMAGIYAAQGGLAGSELAAGTGVGGATTIGAAAAPIALATAAFAAMVASAGLWVEALEGNRAGFNYLTEKIGGMGLAIADFVSFGMFSGTSEGNEKNKRLENQGETFRRARAQEARAWDSSAGSRHAEFMDALSFSQFGVLSKGTKSLVPGIQRNLSEAKDRGEDYKALEYAQQLKTVYESISQEQATAYAKERETIQGRLSDHQKALDIRRSELEVQKGIIQATQQESESAAERFGMLSKQDQTRSLKAIAKARAGGVLSRSEIALVEPLGMVGQRFAKQQKQQRASKFYEAGLADEEDQIIRNAQQQVGKLTAQVNEIVDLKLSYELDLTNLAIEFKEQQQQIKQQIRNAMLSMIGSTKNLEANNLQAREASAEAAEGTRRGH